MPSTRWLEPDVVRKAWAKRNRMERSCAGMALTINATKNKRKIKLRREGIAEYVIKIRKKRSGRHTHTQIVVVDLRDKERVIYPLA